MTAFRASFRRTVAPPGAFVRSAGGVMVPERLAVNVSASQIKTKKMCARKHWFEKSCGLAPRAAHHFHVGHVFHSIAERYLLRQATTWAGLFPPGWDKGLEQHEAEWMRLMAELAVTKGMWQSTDQVQVEYPLVLLVGKEFTDHRGMPLVARATTYVDEQGVRKHGKPQCLYDGRPLPPGWDRLPPFVGFIDVAHLFATPATIEDHKTAKNKKYALNSEKLAQDLQVNAYATVPLALRPELDQVRLKHNVFLKDPEAKTPCYEVIAYTNAAMVARQWHDIITEVEDMQRLRREQPAAVDPVDPTVKGTNWSKVPCAIDEGRTKEACEAYGGCPFRDVCFGRATIGQMTARMTAADPIKAFKIRQETMTFNASGMRARWLGKAPTEGALPPVPTLAAESPVPEQPHADEQPARKEKHMPFGPRNTQPAPLAVHDVVYVLEPQDPTTQYKATVTNAGYGKPGEPPLVMVLLWPDVNVEPDALTCGKAYLVEDLPLSEVSRTQLPNAKLTGYEHVARSMNAWSVAELAWKPRPAPAKPVVPAPASTPSAGADSSAAKVPERKPHDGAFGGGLAKKAGVAVGTSLPSTTTTFQPPAPPAVPAPKYTPKVGQVLRVLPNADAPFWNNLAGKEAIVDEVTMGEGGDMLTVAIDNCPYPNVAAGRFELVREPTGPVPKAVYIAEGDRIPPGTVDPIKAVPVNPDDQLAQYQAMVGKMVSVRQVGVGVPFNGVLEKASEHGIEMMGGSFKAHWDKLESVELFDATKHVPGYKPPKPTKEEREAAKVKLKEDKEAAKAAAKQAKIDAKAAAAAEKVRQREEAKEAAKAAKRAPGGQAEVLSSAEPASPGVSATPIADVLNGLARGQIPPLFKPQEAIPHLDAAIGSLQKVRDILARV